VAIGIEAANFHGATPKTHWFSALKDKKTTSGPCEPLHAAFTVVALDFTLFFARVQAQRRGCVNFFTNCCRSEKVASCRIAMLFAPHDFPHSPALRSCQAPQVSLRSPHGVPNRIDSVGPSSPPW